MCLSLFTQYANGWNNWDYALDWSETESDLNAKIETWNSIWGLDSYLGNADPPRPRRGHSLHLVKTDERSDFGGETYIVMFGGRDNDQLAEHIPRTYNVESVRVRYVLSILFQKHFDHRIEFFSSPAGCVFEQRNGTIVFTTYDEKPVNPCNDPEQRFYTAEEQVGCNFDANFTNNLNALIYVGLIYNDVWAYRLCSNNASREGGAERGFDTPCQVQR